MATQALISAVHEWNVCMRPIGSSLLTVTSQLCDSWQHLEVRIRTAKTKGLLKDQMRLSHVGQSTPGRPHAWRLTFAGVMACQGLTNVKPQKRVCLCLPAERFD